MESSTEEVAPVGKYMEEKYMELIRQGLHLMLTNQFAEADKFWTENAEAAKARKFSKEQHNPLGGFLTLGAMTSMLHGFASLENDQLAKALERLEKADEAIDEDADWVGKTTMKGMCMLLMGALRACQGEKKRGIWQACRSWMWLRKLEKEALNYDGPEKPLIRSVALFSLGLFNLILSFLPPVVVRAASWVSGLEGKQESALQFLQTCVVEEGIVAPFAVIALTCYHLDLRQHLGEVRTDEDFAFVDRQLSWAETRYPDSIWFRTLRADYWGCQRDAAKALEMSEGMRPFAEQLPALGMVLHARRAAFELANFHWAEGAKAYADALEVYRKVGRRSFVPALAMSSALCHHYVGDNDQRDAMVALIDLYKKDEKKKWDFPDVWAFELREKLKDGTWHPELELFRILTFVQKSSYFMPLENVRALLDLLKKLEEKYKDSPDQLLLCIFTQAEVQRQSGSYKDALATCGKGLKIEVEKDDLSTKLGCIPFLLYIKATSHFHLGALAEAKDALKKLDEAGTHYFFYFKVLLKKTSLTRSLGLELKDTFLHIVIPNMSAGKYSSKVPCDTKEIEWEFTLEDFSINFSASWIPESSDHPLILQTLDKYQASCGPVSGRYEPTSAGTLILCFDNKFSFVRSKSVLCRVLPATLVLCSEP